MTPQKALIVKQARELFRANFSKYDEKSACLILTFCVIWVAARHGVRLIPQAGSASWERVTPEQDDGICATHFSYVFDITPETLRHIAAGRLPEMHVWAADPKTMEIVDLTTGTVAEQCEKLTGMDWPGNKPPDYIWHDRATFPEGAFYEVSREATEVAVAFMRTLT